MAYVQSSVHSHEDDLELYIRGRFEPERISAVDRGQSDRMQSAEKRSAESR